MRLYNSSYKTENSHSELDRSQSECPIYVEVIMQFIGLLGGEQVLSFPSRNDRVNLGIGEHRSENSPGVLSFGLELLLQRFGTLLLLVMLYQSRRIDVEHYLRSSIIISEADFPREGIARNLPKGRLARRIRPWASSSFSRSVRLGCSVSVSSGGTIFATGFPRSVITRDRPRRTSLRYRPMRFLNSRLPTLCM